MATYTRADIQDWKVGYEGIEDAININLHKIKDYVVEYQQYNRNIVQIIQWLQEGNVTSITADKAKLENIKSACESAKKFWEDYRKKYILASQEQRLMVLRVKVREHNEQQIKLNEEHKILLSHDSDKTVWKEKNNELSEKVLEKARQLSDLEKRIQELEKSIEGNQLQVTDHGKDEAESLEQMHDELNQLEKIHIKLQNQVNEISESVEKRITNDQLYRQVINGHDLSEAVALLKEHKQPNDKLQKQLSGICAS